MEQTFFEEIGIQPDEVIAPDGKPRGRYGKSRNPNGRPKGNLNKFTRVRKKVQDLLNYRAYEVIENITEACLQPNPNPLLVRVWMSYWCGPPVRPAVKLGLPPATNAAELQQQMLEVQQRVISGEINTEDAERLITMMHRIMHSLTMDTSGGRPTPAIEGTSDSRQLLAEKLHRVLEQKRLNGSADLVQPELSGKSATTVPRSQDVPDEDEEDEEDDDEAPWQTDEALVGELLERQGGEK